MTTFRVGDRVKAVGRELPPLTVARVYGPLFTYQCVCTWVDAHGVEHTESFRPDQLVPDG